MKYSLSLIIILSILLTNKAYSSGKQLDRYCKEDCKSEFKFFRKYSREGSSMADLALSTMYLSGIGTNKNIEAGIRHLKKSVRADEAGAIYQLAYFYHRGIFVEQDHERAILLYEKAKRLNVDGAKGKLSMLREEIQQSKVVSANKEVLNIDNLQQNYMPSADEDNIEKITISAKVGYRQVLVVAKNQLCNIDCEFPSNKYLAVPLIILPKDDT